MYSFCNLLQLKCAMALKVITVADMTATGVMICSLGRLLDCSNPGRLSTPCRTDIEHEKGGGLKRTVIYKGFLFRFHVSFPECTSVVPALGLPNLVSFGDRDYRRGGAYQVHFKNRISAQSARLTRRSLPQDRWLLLGLLTWSFGLGLEDRSPINTAASTSRPMLGVWYG